MPNRGGATEALPGGEGGGARSWGRDEAGGMLWLGTGPSSGRRAASPSLNTWEMLKAARGPASISAQAANTARLSVSGTGL